MATLSGNYPSDNSTLANFKLWAQAISSAFSTFGWVQTADTGQVNWSTISAVPSNTFVYEIWKSNDSLSSSLPIYVRINYGWNSTSPQIQVVVGTSSNGSGTITGQCTNSGGLTTITGINNNQGSTTYPCYFSGNAGNFRMWMWGTTNASPATGCLFVIERSKSTAGADTADYFTVVWLNQNNYGSCRQQSINSTTVGTIDGGFITPLPTNVSGDTFFGFGTVAAMPVFPMVGKCGNPMIGLMTAAGNDAGPNAIITVSSMYGSTHTYLVCASISNSVGTRNYNGTNVVALMQYE